jgi:hypothetical protein
MSVVCANAETSSLSRTVTLRSTARPNAGSTVQHSPRTWLSVNPAASMCVVVKSSLCVNDANVAVAELSVTAPAGSALSEFAGV